LYFFHETCFYFEIWILSLIWISFNTILNLIYNISINIFFFKNR
jgi:hypothetical protein